MSHFCVPLCLTHFEIRPKCYTSNSRNFCNICNISNPETGHKLPFLGCATLCHFLKIRHKPVSCLFCLFSNVNQTKSAVIFGSGTLKPENGTHPFHVPLLILPARPKGSKLSSSQIPSNPFESPRRGGTRPLASTRNPPQFEVVFCLPRTLDKRVLLSIIGPHQKNHSECSE